MNFLDSITLWRSNSSNYRLSPRFLKPLHYLHLPKTGSLYVCMDNNKTGSTNDHQGSIDIWWQKPQKSVGHRGCLYGSSLKQESQWESSRYRREGPTRRRWKRIERMSDDGSNLEVFPGQWGAWHGGEKARWLCDRQRECQAWRSVGSFGGKRKRGSTRGRQRERKSEVAQSWLQCRVFKWSVGPTPITTSSTPEHPRYPCLMPQGLTPMYRTNSERGFVCVCLRTDAGILSSHVESRNGNMQLGRQASLRRLENSKDLPRDRPANVAGHRKTPSPVLS